MDNDEVICDLASPPLSAIRASYERIGFEAAALLEKLMNGEPHARGPMLVPPGDVVIRQSTDVLAVHDEALEKALRFIRANLSLSMNVTQIAKSTGVSRRALERKFRAIVGQSPLQEIRRLRIELAKQLLVETNLPTPPIADRCGFATAQMFSDVFRQQTGQSPTAYRRSFSKLSVGFKSTLR